MNYLLVAVTFMVLAVVTVACAVLGTDRLVPARKVLDALSQDGLALVPAAEPPVILSERPDAAELGRVRFATSALGYNRDEVDGVLAQVIAENSRLRAQLEALGQVSQGSQGSQESQSSQGTDAAPSSDGQG
ncbi:MAG: DivIVA domain-containing protein [Rothia sp. (in: high G+C Gram-positive bacteria)]|nr:DivIVA domain-containing protein [Rothia sp. (in: high G+C Gram-positive bacteria)]